MRIGLSIPNFDEPGALVELGVAAEASGLDGVFLWHHVVGTNDFPVPMADPWVVLGALATATERVRLGTTVTALPRHQPQEVARQAVTVDHLSGGRMVLGVGLGEPPSEYTAIGRTPDRRELAARLDESLEVVAALWTGEPVEHRGTHLTLAGAQVLPRPVQEPRIPVWTSAIARNEHTLGRAGRWDGVIVGTFTEEGGVEELPPDAVAAVADRPDAPADIVVAAPVGTEPSTYEGTGATWLLLTGWMRQLRELAGLAA